MSVTTATISSGQSLSAAVDLGAEYELVRVALPASWDAANLTLQASEDGSTYNNLYDAFGVEYTLVAAASRDIVITTGDLRGIRYLKIRSGTSGTPVSQTADRVITLVYR